MAKVSLSATEKIFLIHGVEQNIRNDGRLLSDYRSVELETDVLPNSNGSARIKSKNSDIMVSVKAELSEPDSLKPSQGKLEFFVDFSANASPEFEGSGGSELANNIIGMLTMAFSGEHSKGMLENLCIEEGRHCWLLYIDVLILECAGNLFDVISFGVKAALFNTKIPNLKRCVTESGHVELELGDDPFNFMRLDIIDVPILITMNQIGKHHLVDATLEEECCTRCHLVIGITTDGQIVYTRKFGNESIQPDIMMDMFKTATRIGVEMCLEISKKLAEEQQLHNNQISNAHRRETVQL